jgi:uncharacterized protein YcaQ
VLTTSSTYRICISEKIAKTQAKALWIYAQGLHEKNYFGKGPSATAKVVEHLGYVQLDTINVIERCHHHILYTRIPNYNQKHLHKAQSLDKSVLSIGLMLWPIWRPKTSASFRHAWRKM